MHGLSGFPGLGTVQVAVAVLVVIARLRVVLILERVKVLLVVVVIGGGVTVLVSWAVAEGMVMVDRGPTVDTMVCVCVEVAMIVGVFVILKVTVGV